MSQSSQLRNEFSKKAIQRAHQLSLEKMAHAYRDLFLREINS